MRYLFYEKEPGRYYFDAEGDMPVTAEEVAETIREAENVVIMQLWRDAINVLTHHQDRDFFYGVETRERKFQPCIAFTEGRISYPPFLRDGEAGRPSTTYDREVETLLQQLTGGVYVAETMAVSDEVVD